MQVMYKWFVAVVLLLFLQGCEQKTLDVLVMGQSNIANHGAVVDPLYYEASSEVETLCDGGFVPAVSPVKCNMATGNDSSFLPMLGDMIVQSSDYSSVRFVNVAVGGSAIRHWVKDSGPYSRVDSSGTYKYDTGLFERVEAMSTITDYDVVLWHQGESDVVDGTTSEEYSRSMLQLIKDVRGVGITAPVLITVSSYVPRSWGLNGEEMCTASDWLIENGEVLLGADSDSLGSEYRYDDLHFNAIGLQRHAEMWLEALKKSGVLDE